MMTVDRATFVPFESRPAQERRTVLEYLDSGAGDGGTVRANEQAWAAFSIVPRVLRGGGPVDTTFTALGHSWTSPIGVAPTMGHGFFVADADRATARAAAHAGAPFVLSHGAAPPVELIEGPFLQQLYLPKDRAAAVPFVERTVAAGALALVVTVDNQNPGGHGYRSDAGALLQSLSQDPAARGMESGMADDLSLRDVEWLASLAPVPVLVKGVLDPRDARDAVGAGAAGVVVSNHGGRQVDRSVTAADALPGIREALGPDALVLADGGIRRASDAYVALALGADAVLLGRPVLHALRTGGEPGLAADLATLRDDLAALLAETGRRALADLRDGAVRSVTQR